MPTSTVPALWQALYELVDGLGLTISRNETYELPVSFGAPMTDDGSFIAIGYTDAGQAVNGDLEWAGLGTRSQDENYALSGLIYMTSGDTDLSTRITEAYAALDAISEALASDYTLGGTCRVAQIAHQFATPIQAKDGSAVQLEFTVAVNAQI